jgi:CHRD domain
MRTLLTRSTVLGIAFAALGSLALVTGAFAAPVTYSTLLDGPSESPPNASPATGFAVVDIDAVANTMHVHVEFTGLTGSNTASHIHAATPTPGTGTAGVATVTPTFTGFPTGATSGVYDHTFDMTLAGSYNPAFVTANGGSVPASEAALFAAIGAGKAYLNVHSSTFGGGEIRGFLILGGPTPTSSSTWGRIKSLYR